jgi:hypothetical protein
MTATGTSRPVGDERPLLGVRHRSGRLALALFRLPLKAYQHNAGPAVGHTFPPGDRSWPPGGGETPAVPGGWSAPSGTSASVGTCGSDLYWEDRP